MGQVLYESTIGITVWMVYAVVAAIIMVVMGLFLYKRNGYDKMEIAPALTKRTLIYVIVVLTALFYILLVTDVNSSLRPLGFAALILVCVVFGIFLYLVAIVAGLAKVGWLYGEIQQIRLQKANIERAKAIKLQRLRDEQEERYRREAKRNAEKKKRARQQSIETRLPRI